MPISHMLPYAVCFIAEDSNGRARKFFACGSARDSWLATMTVLDCCLTGLVHVNMVLPVYIVFGMR